MMGVVKKQTKSEYFAKRKQTMHQLRRIPFVDDDNIDVAKALELKSGPFVSRS